MDDPSTVSMQCSRSLTGFESFATASYMLFFRSRTCSPPAQTVAKVAVFQLRLMNLKESPTTYRLDSLDSGVCIQRRR